MTVFSNCFLDFTYFFYKNYAGRLLHDLSFWGCETNKAYAATWLVICKISPSAPALGANKTLRFEGLITVFYIIFYLYGFDCKVKGLCSGICFYNFRWFNAQDIVKQKLQALRIIPYSFLKVSNTNSIRI